MPDPYTEYLNLARKRAGLDHYSEYLNLSQVGVGDPYEEYLRLLTSQNKLMTPEPGEIEEMDTRDPVGFGGYLWKGFKSGATLGYAGDEELGQMTTGELSGLLIGELGGGLLPLGFATAVTGGYGAPAVATGRMARAYNIIQKLASSGSKINKNTKSIKKLDAIKDRSKIIRLEKEIAEEASKSKGYKKILKDDKKDYIESILKAEPSRFISRSGKVKTLAKAPLFPTAGGMMGKRKLYQSSIKSIAENYGFEAANAANRFANAAVSFAATGVLRKRGEGTFGELNLADRMAGIPKDAWMGALFTVAGLPSMLGAKGAGLLDSAALMGVGGYSDYLTGSPNPNMTAQERLMHALTLVGFHHIQRGFSNAYAKDKMFNALLDLKFERPLAYELIYESKALDAQFKNNRSFLKKEGFIYRNRKDKDNFVSITDIVPKGEKGEPARITVKDIGSGKSDAYEGKSISKARDNLHAKYERIDYTDKKYYDDLPADIKENMDFQNRMKDNIAGGDVPKRTKEMTQRKNDLESKRMKIDEASKGPRFFNIKKVDPSEVTKGKNPVIDIRKDLKGQKEWFDAELEMLEKLKNENPDVPWQQFEGGNWPAVYNWVPSGERKYISNFITNYPLQYHGPVGSPQKVISAKMVQERIHKNFRKEALKDPSRKVEKDFPAKVKDYKEGDIIVIPKIRRHRTVADEGTGAAFDNNESQLAVIIKTNKDRPDRVVKKEGDRYVPIPDASTVRVRTVDLASGESMELNIRIGRSRRKRKDGLVFRENFIDENKKEIDKLRKELESQTKEERTEYWRDPSTGEIRKDKIGRPMVKKIQDIDDIYVLQEYLERTGQLESFNERVKRIGEYIELDVTADPFVKSKGKIDPEIYNTEMFKDASGLVEGKYIKEFYKPELFYQNDKGKNVSFDLKNIGYKGEYIFDDLLEAHKKMERIWSEPIPTNEFLKSSMENLTRQAGKLEKNPDWVRFNNKKHAIKNELKSQGYSAWDQRALITALYPHAKGRSSSEMIESLTYSELSRIKRFIKGEESSLIHDNTTVTFLGDNFPSKVRAARLKLVRTMREFTMPTMGIFDSLGYYGQKIARKLEKFSMWRTNVMGSVVQFEKAMNTHLKSHGLDLNDIQKFMQVMRDPKYERQKESKEYKDFIEKLEKIKIIEGEGKFKTELSLRSWVENAYQKFFDDMAKIQISSNSWIKTVNKKGDVKTRRFVKISDKKGNEIELIDMYENPERHNAQVDTFLSFLKGGQKGEPAPKKVMDKHGKMVVADRKSLVSYYEPNYSPRMITDRFMMIAGITNTKLDAAIHDLMKRPEIRELGVSEARKMEIARQQLNEILNMRGPQGVYGRQWARVADLPTHYYLKKRGRSWEKDNYEVIQLEGGSHNVTKPDGTLYKKGEKILDSRRKEVVIDEVIPVYETDYNMVMKKYSDAISHSTAAAHTYGSAKHKNILWNDLAEGVGRETGDPYYKQFATKVIKNQLYGESRTGFDRFFRPIARVSALTGLSFPVSALKNTLLGTTQDVTVFTSRELLSSMRHLLSKGMYKNERDMARLKGYTHIGAYDLFLTSKPFVGATWLRKILYNAGLMQTTESLNRIVSQSIGPFALKIHVDNVAGIKNAATKGLSQGASRRILVDVFGFKGEEISDMAFRRQSAKESGNSMVFKETETDRARYRSQLVTQGSGDIPYVPYWMGKQWAKPLTLFYRVAYRMTETAQKNVIKPIIVDGNMIPAMKYMTAVTGSGMVLYKFYDWVLDEERMNQFKSMPSNMLDYFIKAEGLGLFSNAFNEYGGVADSYWPVVARNTETFVDMLTGTFKEVARGEPEFAIKEIGDGMSQIVAAYNGYKRVWDRLTGDTQKRFKDSRRRQTQFLDAFYPKEKLDIDFDDGANSKTAYYRGVRDSFWIDDNKRRARSYYSALHYLTHTIMADKGFTAAKAKKEARSRLKRSISKLRPIPTSWRKTPGRTRKSKYHEYYTRLPAGAREEEDALDSLYIRRKQELYNAIRQYKDLYDTDQY